MCGLDGRKWMMSEESKMSSQYMINGFVSAVNTLLKNWIPKPTYTIQKIIKTKNTGTTGLI